MKTSKFLAITLVILSLQAHVLGQGFKFLKDPDGLRIPAFVKLHKNTPVIIPCSFSESFKNDMKTLGVVKCGATHCTGVKQTQMIKEAFGSNFFELGVGNNIVLN